MLMFQELFVSNADYTWSGQEDRRAQRTNERMKLLMRKAGKATEAKV